MDRSKIVQSEERLRKVHDAWFTKAKKQKDIPIHWMKQDYDNYCEFISSKIPHERKKDLYKRGHELFKEIHRYKENRDKSDILSYQILSEKAREKTASWVWSHNDNEGLQSSHSEGPSTQQHDQSQSCSRNDEHDDWTNAIQYASDYAETSSHSKEAKDTYNPQIDWWRELR